MILFTHKSKSFKFKLPIIKVSTGDDFVDVVSSLPLDTFLSKRAMVVICLGLETLKQVDPESSSIIRRFNG